MADGVPWNDFVDIFRYELVWEWKFHRPGEALSAQCETAIAVPMKYGGIFTSTHGEARHPPHVLATTEVSSKQQWTLLGMRLAQV